MKLSIIIPCYNEKSTIKKILLKVLSVKKIKNKQIILVDDFSNDGSVKDLDFELKKKIDKIIYHKKNLGKGAAIRSAIPYIKGDVVIIQDADLEYDPRDYVKMLDYYKSNNCLALYGSRVLGKKRYSINSFISIYRIFFNHFLSECTNFLSGQKLTDAHTCYKMIDSKIIKKVHLKEDDFSFCPEITMKISKLKIKIHEISIGYKGRGYKEGKKINIFDGIKAMYVIIKNS